MSFKLKLSRVRSTGTWRVLGWKVNLMEFAYSRVKITGVSPPSQKDRSMGDRSGSRKILERGSHSKTCTSEIRKEQEEISVVIKKLGLSVTKQIR